jgi:hypothetical protein
MGAVGAWRPGIKVGIKAGFHLLAGTKPFTTRSARPSNKPP